MCPLRVICNNDYNSDNTRARENRCVIFVVESCLGFEDEEVTLFVVRGWEKVRGTIRDHYVPAQADVLKRSSRRLGLYCLRNLVCGVMDTSRTEFPTFFDSVGRPSSRPDPLKAWSYSTRPFRLSPWDRHPDRRRSSDPQMF